MLASAVAGSASGGLEEAWHWEEADLFRALHPGWTHKLTSDGKLGMPVSLLVNKIGLCLLSGLGMRAQLLSIW